MAGQRKSGNRSSSGRATSGSARQPQRSASTRQQTSRQNRNGATSKTLQTGNGAAPAKSRPAGNGSGKTAPPAPARSARAGAADSDAAPASSRLGRMFAPFRNVGPVPVATFILSLYALGASIYLTIAHYDTHVTLVCSGKGLVNCEAVTTSPQSMVFGIFPVAVLGLAYYVFMTALNSPWVWRLQQSGSEQLSKNLGYTRIGAIVAGMGFVLYLIYAELIQIKAICLWCTSVHVATFLIFALIVFYASLSPLTRTQARRG